MARVRLYCGPHGSDRGQTIDDELLAQWGRALLIVPTHELASRRTEAVLTQGAKPGVWGQAILTFQDFVALLLQHSPNDNPRINPLEQRILLERAVARVRAAGGLDLAGQAGETEGFLTHVQRIIAQLKQAAIEPDAFRECVIKRATPSPLDTVVADIYDAYQTALVEATVYDLQGMYWMANLACRNAKPEALANIDLLLLDGFDDFTPSEFRLIESVALHVSEMVFGLNYDPAPGRKDVYALPRETHSRIVQAFDAEAITFDAPAPVSQTEAASQNLFGRDEPRGLSKLKVNVEALACHGAVHEVETIARRVKRLLTEDNVPSNEITIVFRDLSGVEHILRDTFAEFGVPIQVKIQPTLAQTAVGSFMLQLIEGIETWPRDSIVDLLTSPWIRAIENGANPFADLAPLLARKAKIISGQEEWVERLTHLNERIAGSEGRDIEQLVHTAPRIAEACDSLLKQVGGLVLAGERIPKNARMTEFVEVIDAMLDAEAINQIVESLPGDAFQERERAAFNALRMLFGGLLRWHGDAEPPNSRSQFLAHLRKAAELTPIDVSNAPAGVLCMDLEAARHLRLEHVFFGGVNEGAVPKPRTRSAIYSERDIDELQRVGVGLEGLQVHTDREMLLFQRLFDVPTKSLVLTWHSIARRGQTVLRSPFVEDLRVAVGDLNVHQPGSQLEIVVPLPENVASMRDLRNAAFAPGSPIARDSAEEFSTARAGAAIEKARYSASAFNEYDAVLRDPALARSIADRFDVDHLFSVNQLETYASCPFRFYLERVLKLSDAETPDEAFDARVRGTIIHKVLEAFHRRYIGKAVAAIDPVEALDTIEIIVDEQFDAIAWRSANTPRGIAQVEREQLKRRMQRYLAIARETDAPGWVPSHFEVAFGDVPEKSKDALSTNDPFVIQTDEGPVRFSGQIDRIDTADGYLRIIDYKTTVSVEVKDIKEGLSIQLAVYALAIENFLLKGSACSEARFVQVGTKKKRDAFGKGGKDKEAREAIARESIADSVRGIRAGVFHPTTREKPCDYCPVEKICRYERARVLAKKAAHE